MSLGNHRIPFLENNYYHIYNRGLNKQIIFNNRICFEKFYKYIIKYLNEYKDIKLLSYSLLPNHFHFVIHNCGGTGTDISDFMKKIQGSYAIWHRGGYPLGTGTKSPFFEGRFKAKLIDNEKYLHKCLVYVSLNALKHGIVDNVDQYKWTSYHSLVDKDKIKEYKDLILDELEF